MPPLPEADLSSRKRKNAHRAPCFLMLCLHKTGIFSSRMGVFCKYRTLCVLPASCKPSPLSSLSSLSSHVPLCLAPPIPAPAPHPTRLACHSLPQPSSRPRTLARPRPRSRPASRPLVPFALRLASPSPFPSAPALASALVPPPSSRSPAPTLASRPRPPRPLAASPPPPTVACFYSRVTRPAAVLKFVLPKLAFPENLSADFSSESKQKTTKLKGIFNAAFCNSCIMPKKSGADSAALCVFPNEIPGNVFFACNSEKCRKKTLQTDGFMIIYMV